MKRLLKKIIELLFWKYCAEELLEEVEIEAVQDDFIVEFEPCDELIEEIGPEAAVEFQHDLMELFAPKFKTEEEQAMYERRFFTLH